MLVVAKRNEERKRELAVMAAQNNSEFVKDVLKRHNLANTQTLKFEEVRHWLQVVGNAQAGSLPRERANSLIDKNFPGMAAGLAALTTDAASKVHFFFLEFIERLRNYQCRDIEAVF